MRSRLLLPLMLAVGCASPRTEVLVVVDTDLAVPSELDSVVVTVDGPSGATKTSMGDLAGTGALPATLGLVHEGGPLGPVAVRVDGRRGGGLVVRRTAVFDFQPERTLVLRMFLTRDCVGVSCGQGQTCAGGSCRSATVGPGELVEWTGTPPRLDASRPGGDAGPAADAGPLDAGGFDGGPMAMDGGPIVPDGGPADAGADGGPVPEDASADAGPPPVDAGADAGPPPADAGADAGPLADAGADAGPTLDAGPMCASGDCGASCSCTDGCACPLTCSGAGCDVTCDGVGTSCDVTASGVVDVSGTCSGGASCSFDVSSTSNVETVLCEDGSTCDVTCQDVSTCHLACRDTATCTLRCSSVSSCEMTNCPGGLRQTCTDGDATVITCRTGGCP